MTKQKINTAMKVQMSYKFLLAAWRGATGLSATSPAAGKPYTLRACSLPRASRGYYPCLSSRQALPETRVSNLLKVGNPTIALILVFIGISTISHAQKEFNFRRKLNAVDSAGWYSITLTPPFFKTSKQSFSDLRIYQFTEKDTLEAPYVLTIHERQVTEGTLELPAINQSKKGDKQYLTFELKKDQYVNYLDLEFEEENYDGAATLEGSTDQKEWFEIDEQRIISIQNSEMNFTSASLYFAKTNYRYLRVQLEIDKPLTFIKATFKNQVIDPGLLTELPTTFNQMLDKPAKQSIININLPELQPIVQFNVETEETNDYYRSFRLERLMDSTQSPKGWELYYETIAQGFLTSIDKNEFYFNYSLSKKLRLIISNADNAPIKIKAVSIYSPKVELISRLKPSNNTFLYYGNSNIGEPSYDLVVFKEKIPTTAPTVSLMIEEKLTKEKEPVSALIENKIWLWVVMAAIIGLLGFFTLKMMKGKS